MSDSGEPPTRSFEDDPDDDLSRTIPIPNTEPRRTETGDMPAEEITLPSDASGDRSAGSTGRKVHSKGWEDGSAGAARQGSSTGGSSAVTGGSASSSSKAVRKGTVFGGRFEAIKALGKGGMGEVYLVRDRQIEDRQVALKLVRSKWSRNRQFRELFFQEIRSAQEFVSAHVTQIRDCGQLPDGQLFFTMDYVEGESVSQLLRREKMLVPRHALEIARQVLIGLSSGHERGLIHRDVKPSNVMLAARTPKTNSNPFGVQVGLLDFGLAALTEKLEAGRGPGTPHYMSPEQASGQRLDARSDLFAVGVLLFEMISGSRPFQGKTEQEITSSVIETDPSPLIDNLDGVKKPIRRILQKALQKEREKRFSSAAEFVEAIEKCTVFTAKEGAPGWVAGLATVSTVAALAFGGLYLDSLRTQGDAQVKGIIGDTATATELAAANQEVENLRAQLEDARAQRDAAESRATEEASAHGLRVATLSGDLQIKDGRITELEEKLENLQTQVGAATDDRQDAQIESTQLVEESREIVQLLLTQLKDTLSLTTDSLDEYGAKLDPAAQLYDRVIADITNGETGGSSRVALARRNRTIDERTPGFAYLERLEQLAIDVESFSGGGDGTSDRSFAQLAELRGRWEVECSEAAIEEFRADTASLGETAGGRGRWLGLQRLAPGDLEDRVMEIVRQSEQDNVGDELVAPTDDDAPEPGSAAAAAEAKVNQDRLVKRKRELVAWIETNGIAKVTEALYGAQVTEAKADERIAALRAACKALGDRIDLRNTELDATAQQRAQDIDTSGSLDDHTSHVVAFLRDFGVYARPFATPMVQALAQRCEATAVASGALTVDGIGALPVQLPALTELVAGDTKATYQIADEATLDTLRWLTSAYAWYVEPNAADSTWRAQFERDHLFAPLDEAAPPWRQLLVLQVQLHSRMRALPGKTDAKSVYAFQSQIAPPGWWVYSIQGNQLERETLRQNGTRESAVPYDFDSGSIENGSFEWDGKPFLGLRSIELDGTRFETWTPPEDRIHQDFVSSKSKAFQGMGRMRKLDVVVREMYQSAWSTDDGYRCIVVKQGDQELWIHPVLGVVRQKLALVTADLVHVDH